MIIKSLGELVYSLFQGFPPELTAPFCLGGSVIVTVLAALLAFGVPGLATAGLGAAGEKSVMHEKSTFIGGKLKRGFFCFPYKGLKCKKNYNLHCC